MLNVRELVIMIKKPRKQLEDLKYMKYKIFTKK